MRITYDARTDAERLAAPLLSWARLGFLRGFAGTRSDLGPKGRLVLPSAAFHEAASGAIDDPAPVDAGEEVARRLYVEEVETLLRDIQSSVVVEHYRKAFLGWAVDLAMGWTSVIIAFGTWYWLGIRHPVTIAVLIALAIKALVLQLVVRRMISAAMMAFKATSADVALPWRRTT